MPGLAFLLFAGSVFGAAPALPAASNPDDEDADEVLEDVIIDGSVPRGAVRTPYPAEARVERAVIRAIGADNFDEVLDTFASQSRSLRGGDPILLVNGHRIADRSEVDGIPPEAIRRLEIFPEEVALQYGYPPNRRVVNVILRRKYHAAELQARSDQALGDGRSTYRAKANLLRLSGDGRLNLDLGYRLQESLPDGSAGTGADARTSLPRTERVTASGTFARNLSAVELTAGTHGEWREAQWRLGRGPGGSGLERSRADLSGGANFTIGQQGTDWLWSMTGKLDWERSRIATQESALLAAQEGLSARSVRRAGRLELTGSRELGAGPGGPINAAISAALRSNRQDQRDLLTSTSEPAVTQDSARLAANIDVPLLDGRRLAAFSDGALETSTSEALSGRYGAGLRSSPVEGLDLSASYSHAQELPDFDDLAATRISTPNVRVYDFLSGDAGYATWREGGNPDLDAGNTRTLAMRAQLKPLPERNFSLSLEYSDLRLRNGASGTLGPTPQVEAALPERFTRSAGTLLTFDSTPVNVAHQHRRQVRGGINLTALLEQPTSAAGEMADPSRPPVNQLQIALYHTWTIKDEARLRTGSAPIDLLDGGAIGDRGGTSRHLVEGQFALVTRRFGLRLAAQWRSPTRVQDLAAPPGSGHQVTITPGATLDVRMYLNLKLVGEALSLPWLKGNLNLSVNNILGTRSRVRDAGGDKVNDYRGSDDDAGRTIKLSLRKVFR